MMQDAHIHLQDADGDILRSILKDAESYGVERFLCNSTSSADWDTVARIAQDDDRARPFFGIHPWYADKASDGWQERLRIHLSSEGAGIGEIGLDRGKDRPDFEMQQEVFAAQLKLAAELNRPCAIHCVQAWGVLLEMMRGRYSIEAPFMVHLFSGSKEALDEIVSMGGYVSFSLGICAGGSERLKEVFRATPIDRLLLETDFPYMATARKGDTPGARELFSGIDLLYETAAYLKNVDREEMERAVWENGTIFTA